MINFNDLMKPQKQLSEDEKIVHAKSMKKDYQAVFLSPVGQKVLLDIAQKGLVHTFSFTGEPLGTIFNEGKRALCLEILNLANPNAYITPSLTPSPLGENHDHRHECQKPIYSKHDLGSHAWRSDHV